MSIQMVDVLAQYRHIQEEVDQAVSAVIRSGAYVNGPIVRQFCQNLADFLDASHVIGCANGTDALQIALMALDLKAGDEVITPAFNYVATAEVIALLGLKPIFVDADPHTFNLDINTLEAALTARTRAILPVHLFGQSSDMEPILAFAKKHDLYVVEDNAQAIGAAYTFSNGQTHKTGTMGHIGTTSFYPSKNLGCYGDGGAIYTQDQELADRLRMVCNHGSNRRYYHDIVGVNSRLDSLQAAILDIKLKHLASYNENRRKAADLYDSLLADCQDDIILPKRAANAKHVFHQYTLKIRAGRQRRDAIQAFLREQQIPSMIYYPLALHQQKAYSFYGHQEGDFPVAEQLTAEVLSLPMHSELDETQIQWIVKHFKDALTNTNA